MKLHGWSGRWPTDEYPPRGSRIRFNSRGVVSEGVIAFVWCGCAPAFEVGLDDGSTKTVFPTLDQYEAVSPPHPETKG